MIASDRKGDKPFIKLFRSPRNYYFYDVNKNSVVHIPERIYKYLDDHITYEELWDEEKTYVAELKTKGYLSSNKINTLSYCTREYLDYLLSNCIEHITLQITQACNLCCSYCPYADSDNPLQRHHENKNMSWKVAKDSIDFLLNHSSDSKEVTISFYGGEPTLAFALMKQIVEYSKPLFVGKILKFAITTNATTFTEEMMQFMAENQMNVLISLDGPEKVHDKNRRFKNGKGSFQITYNNLKRLVTYYDPDKFVPISINMVLDPRDDIQEIETLLSDPIFDRVMVSTSLIDDTLIQKKNEVSDAFAAKMQYKEFLGFINELNLAKNKTQTSPIVSPYINSIKDMYKSFKKEALSLPETGTPGGPCVPGQHRLFVSTDGTFYPCERVSEKSEAMKIGSIFTGFNYDKAEALLNISQLTDKKCKNCWALIYCNLCAKYADDNGVLSGEYKSKFCKNSCDDAESKIYDCIMMKESQTVYGKGMTQECIVF